MREGDVHFGRLSVPAYDHHEVQNLLASQSI